MNEILLNDNSPTLFNTKNELLSAIALTLASTLATYLVCTVETELYYSNPRPIHILFD